MDSLPARQEQQELIPSSQMPDTLFDGLQHQGQYTAARLFAQRPETAKQIQSLIAEGIGILRISRICKVSPSTVIAVRDRSAGEIENQARQVGRTAMSIANQSLDAIQEAIDDPERRRKVSPRDWAIIAGVAVDKAQLLAGLPTSISLVAHAELPTHEDYEQMVARMGQGGEIGGQKGEGTGPGDAGAIEIPATEIQVATDAGAPGAGAVVDVQEVGGVFQSGGKQDE